jgi:hypothetical protein
VEPDVTYYEELGVESTASVEEIRRAYRKLAQLLHPDQHQDEALRRICERQLARLNGIAEILGDPKRRLEYDLGLQEGRVNAPRGRGRMGEYLSGVGMAAWVWVAAGVAGIVLMALLFVWNAAPAAGTRHQAAGPGEEGQAKAQRAADSVAVPNVAVPKREEALDAPAVRRKTKESPVPDHEDTQTIPAVAQAKGSDSGERLAAATALGVPAGVPQRLSEVVPEARRSAPERCYFAGDWFFSREVYRRDAALYQPEMVEVTITEENGDLRGR